MIVPSRLWRIGRSSDAKIFQRELKADAADFVVDVLIDASGSQMSRQGEGGDPGLYYQRGSEQCGNSSQSYELLYLLGLYDPAQIP